MDQHTEQCVYRSEADSQLSPNSKKTARENRRARRKTSDKADGKFGRPDDRAVIIWAYPDGVLNNIHAELATWAALKVDRFQILLDPPALLVRSNDGTEVDFDAVLQVATSTGEAHARDQGWTSIDDFTVIGRGNGPQRLQDIRCFLEGEAVALSVVRVNGEVILDDQLLVWTASPSAMSRLKRRLFDLPHA
jgi:predicted dehydrogenase